MIEKQLIREMYVYNIDGADLKFIFEFDYEKGTAKFTVSANYLRDERMHQPMIHVVYEDGIDDDTWQLPLLPAEMDIDEDAKGEISYVEYDHDRISVAYSTPMASPPLLMFGSLSYSLPIERANYFIEMLPKGLLRLHTKTYRVGKETIVETERFSD